MHNRCCHLLPPVSLWLFLGISWGCDDARQEARNPTEETPSRVSSTFDPSVAGTIQGRVTWAGESPVVSPFQVYANPVEGEPFKKRQVRPNPHAPRIDPETGGVGNAVVFLRGLDASKVKPWDQPPVRVELRGLQFRVCQGETDSPYGFVQKGDSVEMVSRDVFLHALHAGGVSFFTLMFPQPDQPLSRTLKEKGLVELASAAGCYWMRAYLFVDDHPYYARTDSEGRFKLTQVPSGQFELVCWMPNWKEARHERDPETGLVTRLFFGPPVELVEKVNLRHREVREIKFSISAKTFSP